MTHTVCGAEYTQTSFFVVPNADLLPAFDKKSSFKESLLLFEDRLLLVCLAPLCICPYQSEGMAARIHAFQLPDVLINEN